MQKNPKPSLAFVVATKDRPADLARMLESLTQQTRPPCEIVIVDASETPVGELACGFRELNVKYLRASHPSASAQRNTGIRAVDSGIDLVGFLDDDVVLAPDAFEVMSDFWAAGGDDLAGAGLNQMNPPRTGFASWKRSRATAWLGLYAPEPGRVAPSGWQTITATVNSNTRVDWLPTTAALWRREVFEEHAFDEYFDRYSYLEDVDFSYAISRRRRLAVVAGARYWHYPASGGRVSNYEFGRVEVRNRLYFVRKHRLSVPRCYAGLGIRLVMTLATAARRADRGAFARAWGNLAGLVGWWRSGGAPPWPSAAVGHESSRAARRASRDAESGITA